MGEEKNRAASFSTVFVVIEYYRERRVESKEERQEYLTQMEEARDELLKIISSTSLLADALREYAAIEFPKKGMQLTTRSCVSNPRKWQNRFKHSIEAILFECARIRSLWQQAYSPDTAPEKQKTLLRNCEDSRVRILHALRELNLTNASIRELANSILEKLRNWHEDRQELRAALQQLELTETELKSIAKNASSGRNEDQPALEMDEKTLSDIVALEKKLHHLETFEREAAASQAELTELLNRLADAEWELDAAQGRAVDVYMAEIFDRRPPVPDSERTIPAFVDRFFRLRENAKSGLNAIMEFYDPTSPFNFDLLLDKKISTFRTKYRGLIESVAMDIEEPEDDDFFPFTDPDSWDV